MVMCYLKIWNLEIKFTLVSLKTKHQNSMIFLREKDEKNSFDTLENFIDVNESDFGSPCFYVLWDIQKNLLFNKLVNC